MNIREAVPEITRTHRRMTRVERLGLAVAIALTPLLPVTSLARPAEAIERIDGAEGCIIDDKAIFLAGNGCPLGSVIERVAPGEETNRLIDAGFYNPVNLSSDRSPCRLDFLDLSGSPYTSTLITP